MAKRVTLDSVNRKLDRILKYHKTLEKTTKEISEDEAEELQREEQTLEELKKLEALEREVAEQVKTHPLKKITYKDVARGMVGAFFGAVAHYTFVYGIKVAHDITIVRATILFPLSFIIGAIFLYVAGFRKIQDKKIMWFLPVRLLVLYATALVTSVIVLYLFNPEFGVNFIESYKQVATVSLSAIIGATAADLLGKE